MKPTTVVLAAALLVTTTGGCALQGRTFGQYLDDKVKTARVKVRLAGVEPSTLRSVNVDVYDDVVYLSGSVDSERDKADVEAAARRAYKVRNVVNDLQVRDAVSASPGAGPIVAAEPPLGVVREHVPGIARLEPAGAGAAGSRWTAYDGGGRAVATLYTVPTTLLAEAGAEPGEGLARAVDHVSIYPATVSPDLPVAHSVVVLWHVSRDAVAALRRAE
jgi:hypothetical protein